MSLRRAFVFAAAAAVILSAFTFTPAQTKIDLTGPTGSERFGEGIYVLPNGNVVVVDPSFDDPGGNQDIGAVYLFDGKTGAEISRMTGVSEFDEIGGDGIIVLPNGNFIVRGYSFDDAGVPNVGFATLCSATTGCPSTPTFLNSLIGSSADDEIGSDIRVLPNGNYIVLAQYWDNLGENDVGAVVLCSGTTGCAGNITAGNALVGSTIDDRVGRDLYILADNDFVIVSRFWDGKGAADAGAVTFCSGTTGCPIGPVSAANSLVGSTASDQIGNQGVAALTNGNYVVGSNLWNGAAADTGAATFCSGTTGCVGEISAANSLVGTATSDQVANAGVTAMANGHYVVGSRFWDSPDDLDAGALTWCNGTTGCTGPVTTSNSLYGTSFGDNVGAVMALANGNYVAMSNGWNSATASNAGAATFCLGNGSCTGPVTTSNSLTGSSTSDNIGNNGLALSNGNYLIKSVNWDGPGAINAGAVTFCSGATGCVGQVSAANSLVGSSPNDIVGDKALELPNGNVVVWSTGVDIGGVDSVGAVTLCNGSTGCPIGPVTAANSLVGSSASDRVGSTGILPLSNASFVVLSRDWDNGGAANAGATTICNGVVGCVGVVSAANSLVGTTAGDGVGGNAAALGTSYVIGSGGWDDGATANVGAVTYCTTTVACTGPVAASNSLIGGTVDDRIGDDEIRGLPSGDAIFLAREWDDQSAKLGVNMNVGAVVYFDTSRGETGTIPLDRSVIGSVANGGSSIRFEWEPVNRQVVVGRPQDNTVTLLRPFACLNFGTKGDFDCDGRTDRAVYRPSTGVWWLGGSTEGLSIVQWGGVPGDIPLAGDFDGDGRSDVAIFRASDSAGTPDFYILPSGGSPVIAAEWGVPGDIPMVLDFDDDGVDDLTVFRPSSGTWFTVQSSNGTFEGRQFGVDGDIPLVMDFDGDGTQDLATFRPSDGTWYIARSRTDPAQNYDAIPFGLSGDIPVPADWDGDGKDDVAVFRPSEGVWYILESQSGTVRFDQWGIPTDIPVPGDYDGDGKADLATFRDGVWWIKNSGGSTLTVATGLPGDIPLPRTFVP